MPIDYAAEFAGTTFAIDRRPRLVIDQLLHVKWQCDRSGDLLKAPVPLSVRNGRLVIEGEQRPGRFANFLHGLNGTPQRFMLRSRSTAHWAMVFAWKPEALGQQICLLCSLSIPHCEVGESGIAQDLRLTQAEAKVLHHFAMLRTPREIARALDVSLSTVRSHMKQIYSKASVQSGIQLHQLVHTYCAS